MRQRLNLDRLARLLAASRVSQNHWAIRLGLSRGHWSDIVHGRHPYPSPKTRERMVEVFGVAHDELFEPAQGAHADDVEFRVAIATRYELTSELGQGGMGTVFLANDRILGRLVALKMVAAEAAAGVGADQLLQEIALVSRLQHPNILPLFDAGERAGSPYYVMPYIRGGSLGALMRARTRLHLAEVISLADGIAAGLEHAHEHRVLHCDIKPENILVQAGHPFVMDFGIARKLHSEALEWTTLRKELDFSAGTPAYVSPEQAAGEREIDQRSDIYSFACVVYEMLAGRAPFGGSNTQDIVSLRFREPPPPLQRFAPDVPAAVAAAIERAMSIDPGRRPASAAAFVDELRVAASTASAWRTTVSVCKSRAFRWIREMSLGSPAPRERPRLREWVGSIRQDIIYGFRQRLRARGLTLVALLTLGLGLGLTTAVFAVVNGVLLRPLPYERPERLVALESVDSVGRPVFRVSSSDWYDWKTDNHTFDAIGIYMGGRVSVAYGGEALRAEAQTVSPEFFQVIRPRLRSGRSFSEADVASGANVAVVSEGFWRRALGAPRRADLSVQVNGFPYVVTGVVAAGQDFPEGTDIWLGYRHRQFGGAMRNNINWSAVGRLTPTATLAQARSDLGAVAQHIHQAEPAALYSYGVAISPLRDHLVGDTSDLLQLLMGSVGLVLLIACANLASANLAQGANREREMAVRAALGGGRGRLVRQLLIEHLMLALAGGMLGVLLAWALTRSAAVIAASQVPRAAGIGVDTGVLAFAILVSAAAGIVTGLLPAIRGSRVTPSGAIDGGARGAVAGGRGLPGRIFVGAEIAMALILVTGAGLLVQSLRAVLSRPLGFETRGIVTAEVTLGGPRYSKDSTAVLAYWSRLRAALQDASGVRAAGLANWVPLIRGGTGFIEVGGKDIPGAGAGYRMTSEGYFEALGIPLLDGRAFQESDRPETQRVALINRQMATRYWPGESPLGRSVRAVSMEPGLNGAPAPWITVIGVVADVRHFGYETELAPEMYVLYRQLPPWRIGTLTAVVRGTGSNADVMRTVRNTIHDIDVGIPADLEFLQTQSRHRDGSRCSPSPRSACCRWSWPASGSTACSRFPWRGALGKWRFVRLWALTAESSCDWCSVVALAWWGWEPWRA